MHPFRCLSRVATMFVVVLLLQSTSAYADTITLHLPEFNGARHEVFENFPLAPVTIGTFTFALGSDVRLLKATLTSTFGNSTVANTAGVDYFLDGTRVAQCVRFAACYFTQTPLPWTHASTGASLSAFADGEAVLTAVQTSEFNIRTGVSTLSLLTSGPSSPTPEPATFLLLGAASACAAARRVRPRRRES